MDDWGLEIQMLCVVFIGQIVWLLFWPELFWILWIGRYDVVVPIHWLSWFWIDIDLFRVGIDLSFIFFYLSFDWFVDVMYNGWIMIKRVNIIPLTLMYMMGWNFGLLGAIISRFSHWWVWLMYWWPYWYWLLDIWRI